ncbi:MAG: carboxypeptidase-like regulatory domain-containing protein [Adhaeribacter sp.]
MGKVESAGKPVAFANVLLLSSQDSSLVKGMLTSESGDYVLDLVKPGQYLLQASIIGYRKAYSPVFLVTATQPAVAVNTLKLEQDSKNLTEVSVNAQKPLFEQQLDRMVVNVQSSITAAASTALQVLERSPGILIDHYNNAISLSGKMVCRL